MKVVINTCYGGFSLSKTVVNKYLKQKWDGYNPINICECYDCKVLAYDISRTDKILIAMLEENPNLTDTYGNANLKVVEIPDDVEWEIADYDGKEWVAEKHRTWH
tara:strand:+ start:514 stop:828 length:315 start_codon:yes stop_codon:yes gene_type:complete